MKGWLGKETIPFSPAHRHTCSGVTQPTMIPTSVERMGGDNSSLSASSATSLLRETISAALRRPISAGSSSGIGMGR